MGTFAETALVDYVLFIVCRPRKTNLLVTSVLHFRLQLTNGSLRFPFSICIKLTEVAVFPLIPFCVCRKVSTKVDFWNLTEVGIFLDLGQGHGNID
jgi:hypothetical protein